MSHPMDRDALYQCPCGEWHYKWEVCSPPCPPKPAANRTTCRHENADHLKAGQFSTRGYALRPFMAHFEQLRCLDCCAWLPLGPAKDDGPHAEAIRIEQRAAYLAHGHGNEHEFTDSEWLGYSQDEDYVMCGQYRNVHDDMSEERYANWNTGWLASEISNHNDEPAAVTTTGSTFAAWPADVPPRYNACTDPCDMWNGPCACGAWHKEGK